ncbi:MAG TPA: FHA domain-containing protein, partial [Gemmatimonadaceae bacterium]|nr:FHA domain-containing protein [Gemmatimonadaceae bacterium]
MTLELRVVSGARAGATERFDGPVVSVGRHPTSDLRFDLHDDLDVSARHAELRRADGAWTVHDLGSTNGTLVNGERVTSPRRLAAGDTIAFGARGPRVQVALAAAAGTDTRIAAAVHRQTASLRRSMVLGAGALLALAVMGALLWQRQAARRPPEPARPAAAIDLAAIHGRNDAAIAMIASDVEGTVIAGTAFGVAPAGQLVTSRHVVRSAAGRPARRIRVIFANTTEWLPARLVRTSDRDDLALIQVEPPGRYPVVAALGG